MKNVVFWDVLPCACCTVNVSPSALILSVLMMEAMHSSETSDFTIAIRHHIPEDDNL
jgi:hypothetical protein